jgi:hypothetical protein
MFGAAGSLADASRAYETYRQVDALDTRVRAGVADAAAAAKRTTDTLVASVNDAVAPRDAGRSSAGEKPRRPSAETEKTGRFRRPDRGASSVRAWSVWCFHMGGDTCADEAEGDEVRGTLVKPAGRRAVFLYCDGDRGENTLVASSVLPAGVDAPEPGETMRVGPKAVRVVGEIRDFVVADSEESDDTHSEEDGMDTSSDLEDADAADREAGEAEASTTASASASSWWSWGSAISPAETTPAKPADAAIAKPKEPEGETKPAAGESNGGWFVGWFSAPEPPPAKRDAGESAADASADFFGVPTSIAPGASIDPVDAGDSTHATQTPGKPCARRGRRRAFVVVESDREKQEARGGDSGAAPAAVAVRGGGELGARADRAGTHRAVPHARGTQRGLDGVHGERGRRRVLLRVRGGGGGRRHRRERRGGALSSAAARRSRGGAPPRNRKRRAASSLSRLLSATVSARKIKLIPKSTRRVRRRGGTRRRRRAGARAGPEAD